MSSFTVRRDVGDNSAHIHGVDDSLDCQYQLVIDAKGRSWR